MFKLWGLRELKERSHQDEDDREGIYSTWKSSDADSRSNMKNRSRMWSMLFRSLVDHKNYKEAAALALNLTFENERLKEENKLLRMSADKELLSTRFVALSELEAKQREVWKLQEQNKAWAKRYDEAFNKTIGI